MSKTVHYVRWGDYSSKNPNKPDILDIEALDLEQFQSDLTTNVHIKQKINDLWEEKVLPLKSHESNNSELIKKWNDAVKKKKIVVGVKLQIHTFLGLSKNNNPIRRFELVF
jgi:hypothetical protein